MDTERQLHEIEAQGWKRGVYDDVKRTFRAPFVNWIFRTLMANHPSFLRYAWGQVKPLFDTLGFARYSVEYRDAILSEVADELPAYRRQALDLRPPEYRELRAQLATFDVVAPRLSVLFETLDRGLNGRPIGEKPATDRAAAAPFPDWLDTDRGDSPTMVDAEAVPPELSDVVADVRAFHGFDEGLPSIYRCLAQWPTFFETMWGDLAPTLTSPAFERACDSSDDLTAAFVSSMPYAPRLSPVELRRADFDDAVVDDVRELFRDFNRGPVETVVPALPVYAATVDAAGSRELLAGSRR